jgi:hypothetical protein
MAVLLISSVTSSAETIAEVNGPEPVDAEVTDAEADGSIDDAEGSIDDVEGVLGLSLGGDVRVSYTYIDLDRRDLTADDEDQLRTRWRVDGKIGIADYLRAVGRLAGTCSTDECEPDFIMQPDLPTPVSIGDGEITFDELFMHWFRLDKVDLAIGRMQTKFVALGGGWDPNDVPPAQTGAAKK